MYPRLFEVPAPWVGAVTVYTYGVLLAAAYLLGLKFAMVRAKARGLDAVLVCLDGHPVTPSGRALRTLRALRARRALRRGRASRRHRIRRRVVVARGPGDLIDLRQVLPELRDHGGVIGERVRRQYLRQ